MTDSPWNTTGRNDDGEPRNGITDSEDRLDALDRMLRWYITAASNACAVLATRSVAIDVPPPDGPEPPAFENATAAFAWFDTERPNLTAAAHAALDAGLRRRAWELAMALSPIHATHHTFVAAKADIPDA